MTIVAGFRCIDGLVLCADSQESRGKFTKREIPKIAWSPSEPIIGPPTGNHRLLIAGAGFGPLIDKCVAVMSKAAIDGNGLHSTTLEKIEESISELISNLWEIYPSDACPQVELIFALWTRDGRLDLYKATGPIVNRIGDAYETAGCADDLSTYICDRALNNPIGIREGIPLALYMLEHVKDRVKGCGGESHVFSISNNGSVDDTLLDSNLIVEMLNALDREALDLLLLASNLEVPDRKIDREIERFVANLKYQRKEQATKIKAIQNMIKTAKAVKAHPDDLL